MKSEKHLIFANFALNVKKGSCGNLLHSKTSPKVAYDFYIHGVESYGNCFWTIAVRFEDFGRWSSSEHERVAEGRGGRPGPPRPYTRSVTVGNFPFSYCYTANVQNLIWHLSKAVWVMEKFCKEVEGSCTESFWCMLCVVETLCLWFFGSL